MVQRRLRILTLLLAFPFCIAFGRLAVLQLVPSIHLKSVRESRELSIVPIAPERGRILDRSGKVLARNVPVYDIQLNYSQLNPRDRLVEILADELGETFESFHGRERIDARILELARPEELATPPELPEVLELVQPERDDESSESVGEEKSDGKEWIFLIGSIHREAKNRIIRRWWKSDVPSRSFIQFRSLTSSDYYDLWFSREDIVRQEIVLLRLARLLADGDSSRLPAVYDRLTDRVHEVRARYERLIARDVGPAPNPSSPPKKTDARAYRDWKYNADDKRTRYHRRGSLLVKNVSFDVVSAVELYPASFIGLSSRSRSRRVYPENEVCGSLLGHLGLLDEKEAERLRNAGLLVKQYFDSNSHVDLEGFDQVRSELRSLQSRTGVSGLERYYDQDLRGLYGGIQSQREGRDNDRRVLRIEPAVDGKDITTTIDIALQRLLDEGLTLASRGTSDVGGNAASAVVIDVNTGALLACAGVPSIDPNRMRESNYRAELEARWSEQTRSWLWDRPTRYPLSPGSVFKIVLAAAAIETAAETGFSPRGTAYPCTHEFAHFKIRCNSRYGHQLDQVDLVQALKFSCNNYFYSIGYLLLKPRRIEHWARKFGFGSSPGLDLPGGGKPGRLSPADVIKKVGVCYYSIGQVHVEATPLQVARSFSVIASGGKLPRPHLVKPTAAAETVEFANPETLRLIRDGLWRAAHEKGGTAADPELGLSEFPVALKTGTAEVMKGKEKVNNAWLAGYAPAGPGSEPRTRPRIAFAVVVEETRGHGAKVCAPVVLRLLKHFASSDPDAYSLDSAIRSAAGD